VGGQSPWQGIKIALSSITSVQQVVVCGRQRMEVQHGILSLMARSEAHLLAQWQSLSQILTLSTLGWANHNFVRIPDTHSDHHDLWIDPNNPSRMINGNDGGGVVSVSGGKT